jgi:hypothetical protein
MFSMVRADQPGRLRGVVIALCVFLTVMHVIAHFVLGPLANRALEADLSALVGVSVGIVLAGSAILSQARKALPGRPGGTVSVAPPGLRGKCLASFRGGDLVRFDI